MPPAVPSLLAIGAERLLEAGGAPGTGVLLADDYSAGTSRMPVPMRGCGAARKPRVRSMKGLTTAQLAVRLEMSDRRVGELLEECQELGLVRPSRSGWVMTESAEARYGAALRGLALDPPDAGGSPVARRQTATGLDAEAA
jgi:hypothetical protein